MRVAFVTYSYGWGGTEKHLEQLILRLAGRIEPVILCFGPPVYRQSLNEKHGLDVPVVECGRAKTFREYLRWLRSARPDVVVFVNGKLGLFPWQAYVAARLSGARRVIAIEHLQGEPPPAPVPGRSPRDLLRRLLGWRTRTMLGLRACGYLAHRTVCVSRAVRTRVVDDYGYPKRRTLVIVNGIDIRWFTPAGRDRDSIRHRLNVNPGDHLILCVARLGRLKRVDVLLEAVAQLRQQRPGIRCVIAGDGPLRADLEQRAATLGLDGVVQFAGHHDDVRDFLESADIYVSTSELEGFGLAVAEAISMGLPCVVTDIGGHDEMVAHEKTGLLVPVGSASAVVDAVNRLLDDSALRARLVDAARQHVHAEFNLDVMIERYYRVFSGRAPDDARTN